MSLPGFRLVIRKTATQEIAEQAKYYRLRATPALAERWRAAANDAIRSLRTLPERGSMVDQEDQALNSIRRLPIQDFPKHFIFYHVDVTTGIVTILHMLHGARDIQSLLSPGANR
jgi:plasmid stabilization system protein ParE